MALIACPECSQQISNQAAKCPHCGVKVKKSRWFLKLMVGAGCLFGAFLLIGVFAGSSPEAKDRARDRAAIELCWSDYQRKSLDSDTKRFVASTCEMMEKRFQQKNGFKP